MQKTSVFNHCNWRFDVITLIGGKRARDEDRVDSRGHFSPVITDGFRPTRVKDNFAESIRIKVDVRLTASLR